MLMDNSDECQNKSDGHMAAPPDASDVLMSEELLSALLLEQSRLIMGDLFRRVPFHSLPEPMYDA